MRTSLIAVLMLLILIGQAELFAEKTKYPDQIFSKQGPRLGAREEMMGRPMPTLTIANWLNGELTQRGMQDSIVVIDFWATWCGPCLATIPKNNEIYKKYKSQGVKFIGVCGSDQGPEEFKKVVEEHRIIYPVGRADPERVSADWNVDFWPTYAIIDRRGIVHVIGVGSNAVEYVLDSMLREEQGLDKPVEEPGQVIEKPSSVLYDRPLEEVSSTSDLDASASHFEMSKKEDEAEPAKSHFEMGNSTSEKKSSRTRKKELPKDWLEGERDRFFLLEGNPAPSLKAGTGWLNSEPVNLADLKGKVVVLVFWATWSSGSLEAFPKVNELIAKHGEDIVFIGICNADGAEDLAKTATEKALNFPLVVDADGSIAKTYKADANPDYYVIDREGNLVVPDCDDKALEQVIESVLARN